MIDERDWLYWLIETARRPGPDETQDMNMELLTKSAQLLIEKTGNTDGARVHDMIRIANLIRLLEYARSKAAGSEEEG